MQRQMELLRRMERQFIRERVSALGLQGVEGLIVHLLERDRQLRQEDIVRCTSVDKASVARALARLEELGLVERQVSDRCRREKLVALTPSGRETEARIQQILDQWDEIGYRGFTPQEREQYEAFLNRITENVMQHKRGEGCNG